MFVFGLVFGNFFMLDMFNLALSSFLEVFIYFFKSLYIIFRAFYKFFSCLRVFAIMLNQFSILTESLYSGDCYRGHLDFFDRPERLRWNFEIGLNTRFVLILIDNNILVVTQFRRLFLELLAYIKLLIESLFKFSAALIILWLIFLFIFGWFFSFVTYFVFLLFLLFHHMLIVFLNFITLTFLAFLLANTSII